MSSTNTARRYFVVELTRAALVQANACGAGLAFFDTLVRAQGRKHSVRIEWSPLAQLWLARDCMFCGWATEHGLLPRVDLDYANLSNANLIGADLPYANLSNANLIGADLPYANLSNANLYAANLSNADLSNADLYAANLSNANLSNANLIGANLIGANLIGANLSNANLSNANLSDANLSDANLSDASGLTEARRAEYASRGARV